MKTPPIPILGLAHIGIRVHDLERSVRFYELLGFTKTAGPIGPEPVAILDHPSGLEVNLVLNAPDADEPNILMDVPQKHPGIKHFALLCPDIMAAKDRLEAAGIALIANLAGFVGGPRLLHLPALQLLYRGLDAGKPDARAREPRRATKRTARQERELPLCGARDVAASDSPR